MNKIFDLQKDKIIFVMIAYTIIVYGIGLMLGLKEINFLIGLIIGMFISILKYKLLELTLNRAVTMSEAKAKIYSQRHYLLRYTLTGAVLFISAIYSHANLLGAFLGLLALKVGAYYELFTIRRSS
ncbi:hypothetical protein AN639_00135 [Candidatus Epulonipiscium fishelsonii]|uniref:Uncharacterized protein n=1 Tax=Candidatus Epulonipiscium fishelsonii TaxID=77094 RepID=A0ACC8XEJ2_9FIRM|nr:hypothetical protein AN396_00670 [Epulopiscium sp. SCG-B11WGA-EpuloA1]ONI43934.1 hypothetical protein AN639_00135 [Epulopiscium sp. SCG-B05WGA-EpuloA1]